MYDYWLNSYTRYLSNENLRLEDFELLHRLDMIFGAMTPQ